MSIFDHTDDDGDRIIITEAESGHWIVGIVGHQGDIAQMILDDEAIARLHKASGPEIAPETAREHYGLRTFSDLMHEPAETEISWPEDGRRVAALNAAGEVLIDTGDADKLIKVADWILNSEPRTDAQQVVVNIPDSIDPEEVAKRIDSMLHGGPLGDL